MASCREKPKPNPNFKTSTLRPPYTLLPRGVCIRLEALGFSLLALGSESSEIPKFIPNGVGLKRVRGHAAAHTPTLGSSPNPPAALGLRHSLSRLNLLPRPLSRQRVWGTPNSNQSHSTSAALKSAGAGAGGVVVSTTYFTNVLGTLLLGISRSRRRWSPLQA